ncbi:MAG: OmpH family outer membrane protein [Bacteroidota bacterium]
MNSVLKFFGVSALFVGLILAVLTLSSDKNKKADLGKNSTEKNQKLGNKDSTANTMSPIPTKEGLVLDSLVARNGGIAFVKSEEIAVRFKLMVRKRNALQARLQKAEKEWEGEAVRFRKELEEFQRKSAAMGESQRSATEQMLARKEQNLMQMRESIMEELSKSETVVDQELRGLLDKEFELFSKARGYRFLMARQVGSGLLYGDSLVDVTEQLVSYLNARYP